ncbi:MAG: IclR family transcriptional regulator [Pseudomonadota bacterium]|uniref:IclR family transcriptional regulator n=1 Tax=Rhizorhabdus phycosphaerae TaxID=2711156 RepID=UPI0013EC516E|nr:helix-turn-helix domain-containing protein [Rhizorhabdus phycosphaerae]
MTDDGSVKSASRVFEILELFDTCRLPLSATDVVRKLGWPQSSTVALLKTLVSLGYLAYDTFERTYLPTMRVALLGGWLFDALGPDRRLLEFIRTVGAETAETVSLSTQTDLEMQFLHVERGTKPLALTVSAGDRTALLTTVIGIVALSGRRDDMIARYVERANRRMRDPAYHADLRHVMEQVSVVRERGFGEGDSEFSTGVGALAWLLPPLPGGRRMVLSVAGAADMIRLEREHIIDSVTGAMRSFFDG